MSGGGASSFGTTQTSGTAPESLLGKREQKNGVLLAYEASLVIKTVELK